MNDKSTLKKIPSKQLGETLKTIDSDTILIIADVNVWGRYEKELEIQDALAGKRVFVWKAIDGEKTKSIAEFQSCVDFFLEKGIHRKAHVVAFGGGATSDFAGFVAATLLRGLPWTVIPTTLLSMVDAAIGGKVAINTKSGKNLVGSFHLPRQILICPEFLETLSEVELSSGKGEVAKYAMLDKGIHQCIHQGGRMPDYLMKCAEYKLELTERDFKESGERKLLNLGHTIGHAIEKHYGMPHGVSVVWGMAVMFKIFGCEGMIEELRKTLECLQWTQVEPPWFNRTFPLKEIMGFLMKDKKSVSADKLEVILAEEVGVPTIRTVSFKDIEERLNQHEQTLKNFHLRSPEIRF